MQNLAAIVQKLDGQGNPLAHDIIAGPPAVREYGDVECVAVAIAVGCLREGRALQYAGLACLEARLHAALGAVPDFRMTRAVIALRAGDPVAEALADSRAQCNTGFVGRLQSPGRSADKASWARIMLADTPARRAAL